MLRSEKMSFDDTVEPGIQPAPNTDASPSLLPPPVAIVPALALALSACGGEAASTGSSSGVAAPASAGTPPAPSPPPPALVTAQSAARFLAQATMGTAPTDGAAVVAKGYDGWLGEQFNMARGGTFYDWMTPKGYDAIINKSTQAGFANTIWRQLIGGQDQLRQRVGCALLSILVVGIDGATLAFRNFGTAAYLDILWDNAFGNFRTLLDKVATSPAMGAYLTFLFNRKGVVGGAQPDENFARELMQLFTIGLHQLNLDGTPKLSGGKPIETYTQDDISGLAKVFTGWDLNGYNGTNPTPDYTRLPMVQIASRHELGTKTFLGTTIPANTDGVASLKIALDAIFAHANVAPFISKQLIQHLVTSNPTPAYVQRVASVFENNGSGVRGDLRAVIRAILLDIEARDDKAAQSSITFGKLREPVMRFTAWARAFGATSPSDTWDIPETTSPTTALGQMVGKSPSVFNAFRPGYTPPNSTIATDNMVGPEFQITNEPSVIGYVNFMFYSIANSHGDFKADYSVFIAKAGDSQALLDDINLLLAANQVSAATIAQFKTAVDSLPTANAGDMNRRVVVAILLFMASPEFIVIK
jgi:uncharacterized protein (DUF1800 family)